MNRSFIVAGILAGFVSASTAALAQPGRGCDVCPAPGAVTEPAPVVVASTAPAPGCDVCPVATGTGPAGTGGDLIALGD